MKVSEQIFEVILEERQHNDEAYFETRALQEWLHLKTYSCGAGQGAVQKPVIEADDGGVIGVQEAEECCWWTSVGLG